jgi:glycosyltransferase involved in cell wall biosynthesis
MSDDLRVGLIGLVAAGRSGVSRYAASLLRALDRIASDFADLRLQLVTTEAGAARVEPHRLDVRLAGRGFGSPRAGPRRILAEQLAAVTARADLLHFFDLTGPLLAPSRRFVTTLHDAAPARGYRRGRNLYKRSVHPWALRHATATVAVSAYARDEAVRLLGGDPARISVIHAGPGLEAASPSAAANGRRQRDFLLYVGDLSTHKNLPFLLDVFEEAGVPDRLVLVGRRGEGYSHLRARIESSPAAARVTLLENVEDPELDGLYRDALATVLPSRYEGFGLTPLEAMARDCPVLASDIPAVREVAGAGALLLPLDGHAAWVDAVRRVVEDRALASDLRVRGRSVAAGYSWEKTARELCAVFRHVGS